VKHGRSTSRGAQAFGALFVSLLQLAAATALPAADAVLDAERVALPLHVESPHSESCPGSHDHLFCQVVRSLSAISAPQAIGELQDLPAWLVGEGPRVDRTDATLRPSLRGPTSPRPPPLA